MVGRRPQHSISKLSCLALSSTRSCPSSICPGCLCTAWLVSIVVFSCRMVSRWWHTRSIGRVWGGWCALSRTISFFRLSLPLFPFIRGEVLPATFSLPHLLFFSTLLCLLSSSSSLPPLLSSSHLSLHSPRISVLVSLVSSCPGHVILPLSSVVFHRPSFLRVQPTAICSSPVSLSSSTALPSLPLTPPFFACLLSLLL